MKKILKITFLFLSIFVVAESSLIESISISTIKDTTLLIFEVDSTIKVTNQLINKSKLQLVFDAKSAVSDIKSRGIIRKIEVDLDSNKTKFDIYFDKLYDFRSARKENSLTYKFYPIAIKKIKSIVLDPGHGGIDPGAVGRKGTQEKEINLIITKLLKKRLEDYGLKVYLTRSDDRFVSLAERTRLANEKKADLFISIHCNASNNNKKALGFETYFLSEAKTDLERAAMTRENLALQYETQNNDPLIVDELSLILADLTQNEFLKESYNLAYQIQTAAVNILKDVDRGVKQAGFFVLRGCVMPAVLIECGFISTLSEERKLTNSKHREEVARAIYTGIINYIKDYEARYEF